MEVKNHETIKVKNDGQEPMEVKNDGQEPIEVKNDGQEPIEVKNDSQETMEVKNEGQGTIEVKNDGQETIEVKNDGQEATLYQATDKPLTIKVAKAAYLPTEVEATVETQADVETAKVQLQAGTDKVEGKASGKQFEAVLLSKDSAVVQLGQEVKNDLTSKDVELPAAGDALVDARESQPPDSVEKSSQTREDVEVSVACFEKSEEEASGVAIGTAVEADVTLINEADVTNEIKADVINQIQSDVCKVESEHDRAEQSVATETAVSPTKLCDANSSVKDIQISLTGSRADDEAKCELKISINRNEATPEEHQDKTIDGKVSKELQKNGNADKSEEDDEEAETPWTDMSFSQPLVAQLSEVVRVGVIARAPEKEVTTEASKNDVDDTDKDSNKNDEEQDDKDVK